MPRSRLIGRSKEFAMDKPLEPDLQALYEDLVVVFRKHEYGAGSEAAAKEAIKATIKYVGSDQPSI